MFEANPNIKNRLPVELLEHTLCYLNAEDILVCQRSSRTLYHLVQNSTRIQYIIEMFLARMLDGDMPTRSVYDRLTALRAWRNGWHKAKWTTRSVHESIRDFAGWNSGDTFTEATDTTRSLSFFRVPSLSRRVKEGNWKLEGLNETGIINWHHDDVQDLLIVHDRPDESTIELHLLNSEGKRHPHASTPFFSVACTAQLHEVISTITSSLLALVAPTASNHLWVWDWRKGILLLETQIAFEEFNLHAIDFLDERYIMISGREGVNTLGLLVILDCYAFPSSAAISSYEDLVKHSTLTLELPPLIENVIWNGGIRISCSGYYGKPDEISPLYRDCVFYSNGDSRFLVIEVATLYFGNNDAPAVDDRDHVFVVPIRSLLSRIASLEGTQVRCPWDEWARDTRYLPQDIVVDDTDLCMSHFAAKRKRQVEGDDRTEEVLVILEFDSPYAIRRDLASGDSTKTPRIMVEPTIPDSRCFKTTAPTMVPFREILTDIVVPDTHNVFIGEHSVVLTGENTLVYSV